MNRNETEPRRPSSRELAATSLAVAIAVAVLALAAYWAGGVALDGFRSLGRM